MEVFQEPPLKGPAVEIVDLSSDNGFNDGKRDDGRDDASSPDKGEDDDQLSLYQDMLDGMPDQSDWNNGMFL